MLKGLRFNSSLAPLCFLFFALFLSSCGLERPDDPSTLPRLGVKVETLSLLGLRVASDREAPGRQEKHLDIREAPGRQDRIHWTACEAPGRHSLRGTREAPGRQERAIWTAWEAPGRHQGDSSHRIADRIPVLEGRRILYNF